MRTETRRGKRFFAFPSGVAARSGEAKIKEETRATMRCIPLKQPCGSGACGLLWPARHRKSDFWARLLTVSFPEIIVRANLETHTSGCCRL